MNALWKITLLLFLIPSPEMAESDPMTYARPMVMFPMEYSHRFENELECEEFADDLRASSDELAIAYGEALNAEILNTEIVCTEDHDGQPT